MTPHAPPTEEGRRERPGYSTLRELLNFFSLMGLLYEALDARLSIRQGLEKALRKPVPTFINCWFCFGGITFFLFLVLLVTGILLLFFYQPTTSGAYQSVVRLANDVPFGWLIRGIHHWSANLMILAIFVHILRVIYYQAYRPPRDFNWLVGMVLFFLTLTFGFTGYLLPWNQLAYWATTVGTEMFGAVPLIGEPLKMLVRGGPEVSQDTLTRFFAIHVAILPTLTILFLAMHFAMIRRQGVKRPL